MPENDALTIIFNRNQYYRRQYLLALAGLAMIYLVIFALIGVLVFLVKNPTEPLYFATDDVGRLITVVPVNRPNMSDEDAEAWAIKAVEDAYSYNYVNYRKQFQHSQGYFTKYGWDKYMEALVASNNLVAVKQRKGIIESKVVGKPKLLARGNLGGRFAWKFEMPILLSFYTPPYTPQTEPSSLSQNALNVSVIVQRQPILQSRNGLGIVQLIASMASQPSVQQEEMSDAPTG